MDAGKPPLGPEAGELVGLHQIVAGLVAQARQHVGADIRGDVAGLIGAVSGLIGDVSGIWGDASELLGDVTDLIGDVSGIRGNVSGIRGDVTGLVGNLDEAEIADDDRGKGISILDLICSENTESDAA